MSRGPGSSGLRAFNRLDHLRRIACATRQSGVSPSTARTPHLREIAMRCAFCPGARITPTSNGTQIRNGAAPRGRNECQRSPSTGRSWLASKPWGTGSTTTDVASTKEPATKLPSFASTTTRVWPTPRSIHRRMRDTRSSSCEGLSSGSEASESDPSGCSVTMPSATAQTRSQPCATPKTLRAAYEWKGRALHPDHEAPLGLPIRIPHISHAGRLVASLDNEVQSRPTPPLTRKENPDAVTQGSSSTSCVVPTAREVR